MKTDKKQVAAKAAAKQNIGPEPATPDKKDQLSQSENKRDWASMVWPNVKQNVREMYSREDAFLHEYLEIRAKPKKLAVEYIQEYFSDLLKMPVLRFGENADGLFRIIELCENGWLRVVMTLDGTRKYTFDNRAEFARALWEELPEASSISIDYDCEGWAYGDFRPTGFAHPAMVWTPEGMEEDLAYFMEGEKYVYKKSCYYVKYREYEFKKLIDGKEIDLASTAGKAILDEDGHKWWSCNFYIGSLPDNADHPEIIQKLRDAAKKHLPAEAIEPSVKLWQDTPDTDELVTDTDWNPERLREIQDFFDEMNAIVEPVKEKFSADVFDGWWMSENGFAFAHATWTKEEGFQIIGAAY